LQAKSWADVVLFTGSDRAQLVKAVKDWTLKSKQLLVQLLSSFLETESNAFAQIDWLPQNLLEKALLTLSFTLPKIRKTDNLVDEPEIEYLQSCKFESLINFKQPREQWNFNSGERLIPVFCRSEFSVEKF